MSKDRSTTPNRPPIRWSGILYALLLNLVLVNITVYIAVWLQLVINPLFLIVVAALLAGTLTSLYIGARGGIHAFLGGMISIPLLAILTFVGDWQTAIYAGAFCALAGVLVEKIQLRRQR